MFPDVLVFCVVHIKRPLMTLVELPVWKLRQGKALVEDYFAFL